MRYSLFAGGKRLRPFLCMEASRVVADQAQPNPDIEAISSTLELIHTYSLIHDDLPALDNDDLRRGRPTCHVQFDEATAILAGDALLTLAFHVLATLPASDSEIRARLVAVLATAAGTVDGMIGGQVADLEAVSAQPTPEMVHYIHRSKTAALITAAVVMGAIAENASSTQIETLRRFGSQAGLAFQIIDDVLDVEGTSAALGKTAGKDQAQHKATFPAVYGVARSRAMAYERLSEAKEALATFGERASTLRQLADSLVIRNT
ncbi:MAG: polyprenyl synthetase family protein [Acidobacteria bacterium]|nr:polyprenyl synthetase family protein [Acidobacteriota bacterium]